MPEILKSITTSVLAFASTNIDDIFILILFFGGRKMREFQIIAGQYIGISVLVLLSMAGAFIGSFFDPHYVGLLGLFPIYLAIKQVIALVRSHEEEDSQPVSSSLGIISVAGVTIANGADNIGVYVPLISTMSRFDVMILIVAFAIMTMVWCIIARKLAGHPVIAKQLNRFGHILMPVVLLSLGLFILIESGSLLWIINAF